MKTASKKNDILTLMYRKQPYHNLLKSMKSMKADSLSGFIAGFLVGVMGMYVYVVILTI